MVPVLFERNMKLLINGKEETIAYVGETLGDFLVHVEQGKLAQGNVIRSVKLNGQASSPDSYSHPTSVL